jgi:adenylosuccinate lyase
MSVNILNAVSPVDGRYRSKSEPLAPYFSEYALLKYRVKVEIEYFIWLCEMPLPQLANFDHDKFPVLRNIYQSFSESDAAMVKEIEKTTNHDVKAVEYFIKHKFDEIGSLDDYKEFVHFGLTSQDINNTSFPMMIGDALREVYFPALQSLTDKLESLASEWSEIPMLAHTHGQPASPTRLGKEIKVFAYRIECQVKQLKTLNVTAKFGGATGNFNAHHVAYPEIDWVSQANSFLAQRLGLEREQYTTQISNYDGLAAVLDALKRINTVLLDLDRDFWTYISMNYFKQKIKAGEVGSSAMPHKVNPIDYENSEGNLGIANALFEHLSRKLPVSRLQRDLTDSTVIRNLGVPLAHTLIAIQSTLKGLNKLLLNREAIEADLENNWEVVAEAIQTVLRREKYPNPYEILKTLTRTNKKICREDIADFIGKLNVSEDVKRELLKITPQNYVGV